jgi:putative heme iron utilization protein
MSASIQDDISTLIESRKSLLIASLNNHNLPEISATPFIKKGLKFYVFISELSSHTQNLKAYSKLSVMLIEDEQDTKNPFARKRLSYECVASIIAKNTENWQTLLDAFEERQGKTVSLLKQLPDFHLFELTAILGNYIEGFGKAYRLSGENLEHIELQTK